MRTFLSFVLFVVTSTLTTEGTIIGKVSFSSPVDVKGQSICNLALELASTAPATDFQKQAAALLRKKGRLIGAIAHEVRLAVQNKVPAIGSDFSLIFINEQLNFPSEFLTPLPKSAAEARNTVIDGNSMETAIAINETPIITAYHFQLVVPVKDKPGKFKIISPISALLNNGDRTLEIDLLDEKAIRQ